MPVVIAISRLPLGRSRTSDGFVVAAMIGAAVLLLAVLPLFVTDTLPREIGAAVGVILPGAIACLGLIAAREATSRSAGVERRVWILFSRGLACWALGFIPYIAFLLTGGQIDSPAAWSQIGFLAAGLVERGLPHEP